MLKKLSAAALAVVFIALSLSACVGGDSGTLNISGAQVSGEVYAYYLDKVVSRPLDYSLNAYSSRGDLESAAGKLCAEYVAVNTAASSAGVTLDQSYKAQIASDVCDRWRFFSEYYRHIGVSKQTLTKILTNEALREKLFLAYYSRSGLAPVPESELEEYFYGNYITFDAINGYLTYTAEDGSVATMTDEERESIKTRFDNWGKKIDSGISIDEVGAAVAEEQGLSHYDPGTVLINRSDSVYPEGFFDAVHELEFGVPSVLTFDDYIFLVVRVDASKDKFTYFENSRTQVLYALRSGEFDKTITSLASSYDITPDLKKTDKIYSEVSANVNNK